jgi:hypothetical protein
MKPLLAAPPRRVHLIFFSFSFFFVIFKPDYWPVVNALCCAKFGDNVFYRARIEVVDNEKRTAHIFYIDYGNKEETSFDNLYELPEAFWSPPPLARELYSV